MRGSYTFSDINADSEGTSTYRWLRSDSENGTYSAITGATAITYVVTSADLSKYLKFEVTPVSTASPTTGSAVQSSATSQVTAAISNYFYHILSTGQSLSIGMNGSPALTTTQPYNNKMLSGSSLTALIESSVETISSALANWVTSSVSGNNYDIIVTRHGVSSTAYTGLKKGTTPYNNGMTQVSNAITAVSALSRPYKVTAVTVIHGESDHVAGTTQSQYEADLVEWQSDYETDVRATTGQADSIPLFTDQMSSWTGYSSTTSVIPYAQLAASVNNPGKIILIGPKYFLNYSDTAHLTNTSYRWLGEYYGKVYKKVLIDRESWTPLSPSQVVRNGNAIYAQFNVPESPIVFDTTNVDAKTNYGFEYADDSSSASISNVEILNANTVKVTLSTTPTGANQKLRYAYTGTSGSNPGAHVSGSARGNLRDSDSTTSLYGNNLYNWLVHFNESITADTSAPTISNVSVSPNSVGGTVTWTTNEPSSSIVDYGLTNSYGNSTTETDVITKVTNHSISLSGLSNCTTYHYRVRSKDLAQNEATSSDGTFTTTGCTTSSASVSNTSNTSTPSAPTCSQTAPGSKAPWLYSAVAKSSNSILLYFAEADDPVDHYALEFGTKSGEYSWAATDIGGKGTRMYLVQSLQPNTTYYFRVRGGNGCATGPWSNEISAKTLSLLSTKQLDLTTTKPEGVPIEDKTEVPKANINGKQIDNSISENKEKEEVVDKEKSEDNEQQGYKVKIKVVNKEAKPVEGAKVTIHSKVQETITDKNGFAEFSDVEPGDHKVLIAYNGYEGEQSLNLTGDVKEFSLTVTIEAKNVLLAPQVLTVIGGLGAIIVVLLFLLFKSRGKSI